MIALASQQLFSALCILFFEFMYFFFNQF
ncbi:Protein CBG27458 [Caenorhabditis briggsae]|uniref:Protein CBG27458 n=1 Tax=Caenorhabditis briggsae TaxID=6238 RepID=E3CU54_CAEBR|nr:Protein CBG27458 [Caenorhabditis briggsae]CBX33061.1 Protein CBG27458 [Caenorhabditis briggsae]